MNEELQVLIKIADAMNTELDKDKFLNLYKAQHHVIGYMIRTGKTGVLESPKNTPELIRYLEATKLGEFVPNVAIGFENERILTEDLKHVTEAVKTIIEQHKTA